MSRQTNKILSILFFTFSFLFAIGYIFFHFLITREFADNSNIRKFNRNKDILEYAITASIKMCEKRNDKCCSFTMSDFSSDIQQKLKRLGISSAYINILKDDKISVKASFDTDSGWYNRVLNHVMIEYSSSKKTDKQTKKQTHKKAIIYDVNLGNGWSFHIDTDYI